MFRSSTLTDNKSLAESVINKLNRKQLWQEQPIEDHLIYLQETAINAALATFTYGEELSHISDIEAKVNSSSKHTLCRLEDFRSAFLKKPVLGHLKFSSDGVAFDNHTGLIAVLFYDQTNQQLKLVFGGTRSGKDFVKQKYYRSLALHQLSTDLKNLVGNSVPTLYQQAAAMVSAIKDSAKEPSIKSLPPKTPNLLLLGHSLGGALAQYAAVKNSVKAVGFSSAALGYATLLDLAKGNQLWDSDWVKQHIQQFFIAGDPVCSPNLPKQGGSIRSKFYLTNLGTRHIIKPTHKDYDSYMGRHSYAEQHVLKFIEEKLA